MRERRYRVDLPHSATRLWALMQDYERWAEHAPMVVAVEVVEPRDAAENGLLRHGV
jgi:ribosome-associated toxin RatA of RatAB toxin-antitoxin module